MLVHLEFLVEFKVYIQLQFQMIFVTEVLYFSVYGCFFFF